MKIGILGTGIVGQTLAAKLDEIGNEVVVGTRDVAQTLAKSEPSQYGLPPIGQWMQEHARIRLEPFAVAAQHGEVLINATNAAGSLSALEQAGAHNFDGKILIDASNPLDFSQGMPPTLFVCNTDSLGEQIQRSFPQARVVKAFNTLTAALMVDPQQLAGGDHTLFICGDDAEAKGRVTALLGEWFGWRDVLDLGPISSARGMEMYLPLWLRMWGAIGSPILNVKVVR